MTITTILLLLSLIVASGLSYYQYFYKAKKQIKAEFVFGFRFLSLFGIILLLINPIITRNTLEIIKPSLAIVVDNSVR
jgi:lipid-A-disaccharide synthase-like uncharacterized protein